jgi:hypothetical protein
MLEELGINPRRKKGMLENFFAPHSPVDYRGMVEEWKISRGLVGRDLGGVGLE